VENRRWTVRGVTYATLNVQGSCNNLCDVSPDPDEWAARNAAAIAWLQSTFEEAQQEGSAAVMMYKDLLVALRDGTIAFGKPVALVHGDSHYFRIDKPLLTSTGRRVQNFTRVETFGDHPENDDNDVQWLRVDVNPRTRGVFSYQPQIIPENAGR
jgi:hypothetical protein